MIRNRLIGLALASACLPAASVAAMLPATPEAAMSRLVALNNSRALRSAEAEALLGGELDRLDWDGGGQLPPPDRIVATGKGKAVARIPAMPGANPDLYFYLEQRPDGWSIVAYRTLALTGVLQELVRLSDLAPAPDAKLEAAVRNARLVLSPDRVLIAWAARNRDLLERARADPRSAEVERDLKAAGGNRVRMEEGRLIVSIGGILDNVVGFLWAPEGKPPPVDPSNHIWIEDAGGGWYLFKTT